MNQTIKVGVVALLLILFIAVFFMTWPGGIQRYLNTASAPSDSKPAVLSERQGDMYLTSITLRQGWNLISVPLVLNDSNVERVFIDVIYDVIYSWNADSMTWDSHMPGIGGNLTDIAIDRGYWIHVNRNDTIVLYGYAPGPFRNVSLCKGWNLVGYSGYTTMPLNALLGQVNYRFAYSWNSSRVFGHPYGSGWEFSSPEGPRAFMSPPKPPVMKEPVYAGMGNFTGMEQGSGYWLYVQENSSWQYPTNYPSKGWPQGTVVR
ncbi:MAG: hypothetical protein PHG85_07240 [Candidatus Altiarchaeota archaeon]|nr:hypothetical protein [Candidatus Altiarchaeota archaeon]